MGSLHDDDAVARLRREYTSTGLSEIDATPDPVDLVRRWLEDAIDKDCLDCNAVVVATATPDGRPDARTVLLRGLDDRGFVFFTNYDSAKGRQLEANPRATMVFYWAELSRQVRVSGSTARTSADESDDYFATRPAGAQLGAWASPQSQVIDDRGELEARLAATVERFAAGPVPRPPHWGGIRLVHEEVELWQGRPDRLHDRLRYRRHGDGWLVERLAP